MSLDIISPAEFAKLRYVISCADKLDSEQLDKLHEIEQSARNGNIGELSDYLSEMYNKLRKQQ